MIASLALGVAAIAGGNYPPDGGGGDPYTPATTTATHNTQLPDTGGDNGTLTRTAAVTIAAGVGMAAVARHRRKTTA